MNETTHYWLGKEIICEPVTGSIWHRVIGVTWLGAYGPFILVLEGGNELNPTRIDAIIRVRLDDLFSDVENIGHKRTGSINQSD